MSASNPPPDSARRVRRLLIAAYVAAAAACVGLPAWFSWSEHEAALETAALQTRSYARALDEHVNRAFVNAALTLEGVADLILSRNGLDRVDPAVLHEQLRLRARRIPELSTIFVYGRDLTIQAHSREQVPPQVSGASFEHVAVHRDSAHAGMFIGRPLVGPVTGIVTVPLTIGLRAPEGQLLGVVGGALDLGYFDRFYRSLGLPPDASVSIVRRDGTLLERFPTGVVAPGTDLSARPLMQQVGAGAGEGTFAAPAVGREPPRILSWRRSESHGMIFVVARTREGALAPWRATLPKHIAAAIASLLAVTLLAFALRLGERRRSEADAALRSSEERFASFFRTNPLAGAISSLADGRFVEVNDAWVRTFGHDRASVIGRTAVEIGLFGPQERERVVQAIEAAPGQPVDAVMHRAGGEAVEVRMHAETLVLEGEHCILALIEDVTAERAAEAALRASERRFAAFFRSSPAAHAMVRRSDGVHIELSDGWLRMFRMRREDAIGRRAEDLRQWARAEEREVWLERLGREGRVVAHPAQMRRSDGETFSAHVSGELIELEGEACILSSVVDVSAEAGQRRAEERLAAFFRSSPLAHSIVDFETNRYVEVNAAFEHVFGITREETIGRTGIELGTWPEDADTRWFEAAGARPGEVLEMRMRRKRRGGEVFDAAVGTTVVEVDGRRVRISSLRDVSAEVRAEVALRESEERLATFLRTSPVAHSIYDVDAGRIVDVNAAWERMFGFSRDEALAAETGSAGGWIDPAAYDTLNNEVLREGSVRDLPGKRRRKNGQVFDVRISAERIDIAGRRFRITSIVDVSGEMRAREALERLAVYFRLSPAALIISRLDDGCYVEVNEAYERMFGYSREEVIGKTSLERGVWGDPAERAAIARSLRESGRVENHALRVRRKDGTWIDLLFSAERMDLEGIPHLVTSVADVTETERARRALAESEERFARFFRSSPVAQVISEVDSGVFREVNDAWVRMVGYAREEAVGRTTAELRTRVNEEMRKVLVGRVLAHGHIEDVALKIRRKSGEVFDAIHAAELFELGGQRLMLTTIRDVSAETAARVALEDAVRERTAELEASNRELESFSYSVSHDMRAPIRAISSYAEILRSSYGAALDEDARQVLDRIARAGGHLGGLVDALLDLSRLMRTNLERTAIDLSGLAAQVVAVLREREPARMVEAVIAPGLVVEADPVLARSLLENLLGNAWKYTARRADARLEFGREGVEFYVRDNGVGFDMAYADKLFKPFERLHRAGEFPGTGIGLATVERIVRRHHGTLRAHAEPGKGATFWFTLPG